MRTIKYTLAIFCLLIIATPIVSYASEQKSVTGEDDIGELMAIAESEYDLEKHDAVFLLDEKSFQWSADGRLTTTVHRIIWVGTDVGVEEFGDHRIAYDHEHTTFEVTTVRTWRDNQYWETGETGIVETLPRALRPAYDYGNMREMMLLHDGIEIPCILEIHYTVEDKAPYRGGAEGMWLFGADIPTVKSRFNFTIPVGYPAVFSSDENIPQPEIKVSEDNQYTSYVWTMGPLEVPKMPYTDDPAAYTPHVIWSTWKDWTEFGNHLGGLMKSAAKLDSLLAVSLDSLIEDSRTGAEKANLIAGFIEEKVGYIDYPENFWYSLPRSAVETYNSAYGHRLDRAVLAAAMFKRAGLEAIPVFISDGYGGSNIEIPSLARMGGIGIWVSAPDVEAYYDPAEGTIKRGLRHIIGRTLWSPGREDKPGLRVKGTNEHSNMSIILDMTIDADSDTITGTGFMLADNGLNVFDRMEGLSDEGIGFLESSMSGVIEGISIIDYSLNRFDLFNVTCGFDFVMEKPENDDFDRLALNIGNPEGGVYDHLPDDITFYESERTSPISLQCLMRQNVELRIRLKGLEPVYLPDEQKIENGAGSFSVTVNDSERRISIIREIYFPETIYGPELWPDLRNLLLADNHKKNRLLLFKLEDNSEAEK